MSHQYIKECPRCKEFEEIENEMWGWDGYHVEDAVSFARHFRAERDELLEELIKIDEQKKKITTNN